MGCKQCVTCDNFDCGVCSVCYPLPVIKDGVCSAYDEYIRKKPVERKEKKRKKNAEE